MMKKQKIYLKSKLLEKLVEWKIKTNRGISLVNDLKNAVLISAGFKILFDLTLQETAVLTLICLVGAYLIGYFDLSYLGFFQKEQELLTSKYNPHLNKIKRLKK